MLKREVAKELSQKVTYSPHKGNWNLIQYLFLGSIFQGLPNVVTLALPNVVTL